MSKGSIESLVALLLGALTVLGFAPFEFFPLPILSLATLFILWRGATSPRRAAWLGWLWGCGHFLCGVSWVYVSMHNVGGMFAPAAVAATLAFCAALALYPALAGAVFARFKSGSPTRDALLVAATWTLSEWLRGWLLTGFPWLASGYAQTPPSPLAGYAAVLGVYGIGLLAAVIAGLIAFCLRRGQTMRERIGTLATMIAIISFGAILSHMDWTQPSGAPLTVSLLQGNIPQETKWDADRVPVSLRTYAKLVHSHPAQLVVLPETALPMFLDDVPHEYLSMLMEEGPTLTGVAAYTHEPDKPEGYVNIALALDKEKGLQAYSKRHLVPFGEYVPAGFAWFMTLMSMPLSDFSAGPPQQPPLEIAGQKIAANICYEDLFGEEIIRALPEATLLVNLSNTAWFGQSLAQPQHLQIARMRALETGRTMLRATNTGMTAAIAPNGQVIGVLPAFTTDGLTVQVQGYSGATPFVRWGNQLALLLAVGALLPALRLRWRQRHCGA